MQYPEKNPSSLAGIFLILSVTVILLVAYWQGQSASPRQFLELPQVLGVSNQVDPRINLLTEFLENQGSPLAPYTATMIQVADTYKFDWRLLPAIAGKESTFGKNIPWDSKNGKPSHNAWGWGVYDNKTPVFSSWEEGIRMVAEGLRHEYYNKGYITPEIIMTKFTPRSDGSWARHVESFMEQIAPE